MVDFMLTPRERLVKARIKLLQKNPFFAHLAMYLNLEESKNVIKTGGTCGVNFRGDLFFNPEYIGKLNDEELMFLIAHETGHLAFQHLLRMEKRELLAWNVSCDLAINDILEDNNFTLTSGSLISDNYRNMSAEQIYDKLPRKMKTPIPKTKFIIIVEDEIGGKQQDNHIYPSKGEGQEAKDEKKKGKCAGQPTQSEGGDKKNGGGKGDEEEKNDMQFSDEELKEMAETWKKHLVEASVLAKQRGDISAGMERLIDNLLETKHNWRQLLYKYMTREIPFDYSWSYPSKKSTALGIYLPSVLKENINLVAAIDTSGSISKEEITEFVTELKSIVNSFSSIKITLIICDCEIQDVVEVDRNYDLNNIKLKGYGGTSHVPVYKWIEKNMPMAKLLINFTDGYTSFPSRETTKTIWVITKNGTTEGIPFGDVIKCE